MQDTSGIYENAAIVVITDNQLITPNYKYTAEADKKRNAFDLSKLLTRRMDKVDPKEEYAVYEADVPEEPDIDEEILNYDDIDDPDAYP